MLGCLLLGVAGCSHPAARELVVWSGFKDSELKVIASTGAAFARDHGIPVRVVRVPFTELQPKLQVSIPVGQGPDLVTGPHDWIGPFVTAGLISPLALPPSDTRHFLPVSLQVMTYGGRLYGLPLSVTALGLVTNRALLPEPPATMAELIREAQRLTHGDQFGLLFDDTDFYVAWPFFGGFGAYLFGPGPNGLNRSRRADGGMPVGFPNRRTENPLDVGLANAGAVRAGRFLQDLHLKYHLLPVGTNRNSAKEVYGAKFRDGRCAMTITGPWSLEDYRKNHIDYVFSPIPKLDNGRWPSPLVGVDGLMLTSCSRHAALATQLMQALAGKDAQVALNLAAGRVPARRDAQADPRVAENPDVAAIGRCVEKGTPMPTIPALSQVWEPMADALVLITSNGQDPAVALRDATRRIETDIRKMME